MDMDHFRKMRMLASQMEVMKDCQTLIGIYTNELNSEELSSEDKKAIREKIEHQKSILQVTENMYNAATKKN
jgi:hypothetical protein